LHPLRVLIDRSVDYSFIQSFHMRDQGMIRRGGAGATRQG